MHNLLLSFAVQASSTETEGGLFDFNATLPLMALQFIVLTVILNVLYYKPVGKVLDEREEYIRNCLTTASASLLKADELTRKYEHELAESRKNAQNVIKDAQNEAQVLVSDKIKEAKQETDSLLQNAYNQLNIQKEKAFKSLEEQVDILSDQIQLKLLDN
uniref:ATP synthase subunit b n=1 Tax=Membranoptera platyphylla TaxID=1204437 RepID=A0A1I9KQS5_9FLOR|nr:ATP synthase subunit b' [Membranoptera platyphylla]AMJ16974.1 ATP synthase subunit b' [Membranoptera platyphylla]